MRSVKIFLVMLLGLNIFSMEKSESFKNDFTNQFIVERLILAEKEVHKGVEKYNKKNSKNPIKKNDREYTLVLKDYTISFTYLDIVMREVSINKKTFSLNPYESHDQLKKRLSSFFPKRKQSFIRFFIQPAYAASDETFDAILNAVLHLTNYTRSFWFSSHLEESQKVFDEIKEKNNQCQSLKSSGKKDLIGGDPISKFVSKILYSTNHEELETFKQDSNTLLIRESGFRGESGEKFREKLADLRGCGVLGYMLAKHVHDYSGSLLNSNSRSLRNISSYGQGSSVTTSLDKAREFCREFDELASCVTELSMFDESIHDKFKRDKKQLEKKLEEKPSSIFKSEAGEK